jgi:PHP family Zn ribbon phosphoesterase
MKIAVDLHIHSALSPCADQDMTPNNIINMAILKGLDAISITDHNSCDNVRAAINAANGRILVLPGMEVQTIEDVHLLCYFNCIEALEEYDKIIRGALQKVDNIPEIFGEQTILDEMDQLLDVRSELLITSVNLSVDDVVLGVRNLGGMVVPAHVNRPSYSILSNLGFIPDNLYLKLLEISHNFKEFNSLPGKYWYIYSSDAHHLQDIMERVMFLEVTELTISSLMKALTMNTDD